MIRKLFYKKFVYFFHYVILSENNNLTYYKKNREKILNKAKNKYKILSEEDKIKKREYAKNRYTISEEDKNKASEYAREI